MKMSKLCWVASLSLIAFEGFLPLSAHADDWFYLSTSEDNTVHVFVDQASVVFRGEIASVRSMFVYPQIGEDSVVALIQMDEFDCGKNQWRVSQLTYLYDDQSFWQEIDSLSAEWRTGQPQSFGALKLKIACGST
jgi:hypothetical protein